MKEYYTLKEVAAMFDVTIQTVLAWKRNGYIEVDIYLQSGRGRFSKRSIENFIKNLNKGVNIMTDKFIKIKDVAEIFGVTVPTVRNWEKRGQLVPEITLPSGRKRYTKEQIDAYLEANTH